MNKATKLIRNNELTYNALRELRDTYSYLSGMYRGTFSQHGEDTFIYDMFKHKKDGFYVEIGASHPFRISNTYLLYKKGWRGVTVEPIPLLCRLHKRWRPKDKLIQKAIGTTKGSILFYEMLPSVLSTLDEKTAHAYVAEGKAQVLRSYDIDVITIGELFAEYVGKRPIDLLSIDVEGLDADIVTSSKMFSDIRPETICIEANEVEDRDRILGFFAEQDYKLIAELGCNLIAQDALR